MFLSLLLLIYLLYFNLYLSYYLYLIMAKNKLKLKRHCCRSIEELQQQNQKLLGVIRELSEEKEKREGDNV